MLTGEKRLTTVVATSFCELYRINKAQLDKLLELWPEVAKEFENVNEMLEVKGINATLQVRHLSHSPLGGN